MTPERREEIEKLRDSIRDSHMRTDVGPHDPLEDVYVADVTELLAALDEAERERDELREIAVDGLLYSWGDLMRESPRFPGWMVTNCSSTAIETCEQLVKMGLAEKHPDPNAGVGRAQFYRLITQEAPPHD